MARANSAEILSKIKNCVRQREAPVSLHQPSFIGNEWEYVKDCLDSGWVSSVGRYVDRFEESLASFTGVKHAIAVANGTSALQIALQLAGVEADDEVLVPTMTFVASTNAIAHCGAIPHFVDCDEKTFGVDPHKLSEWLRDTCECTNGSLINRQTGRRIAALIVVHIFGHPALIEELDELCREFQIALVEDAAESIGSYYNGRHTGSWGKLATLSFNGNKTITTGGGGAILTNDSSLALSAKHLTTTAKVKHPWKFYHDQVAYNYRLPNINAALGCAQMEQLPRFIEQKRSLALRYIDEFKGFEGATIFCEPVNARSNYWLNALLLNESDIILRDEILDLTNSAGLQTRPVWELMHTLPMFANCPRMNLHTAEQLRGRIINLPSSAALAGNF